MTALTSIFTTGTALAGHDDHDHGIDYRSLDSQAAAVMNSAHELVCSAERENRSHRGHDHSGNDARIISYLNELERRIGHVHNAIHTRCSLPTIERRAEYAHKVADATRQKIRSAGGLSRDNSRLLDQVLTAVCALEDSVAHASHGHAQVDSHNDNSRGNDRGREYNSRYSNNSGRSGIVLNFGRR